VTFDRVNVPALVALWARQVDELTHERGDALAGHDYLERLAVRHEIAKRLRVRPASAETRDLLAEFDQAFRSVTTESTTCLWGNDRAEAEGWTPQREWYFWRQIGHPLMSIT
jgi:hypothetical protein